MIQQTRPKSSRKNIESGLNAIRAKQRLKGQALLYHFKVNFLETEVRAVTQTLGEGGSDLKDSFDTNEFKIHFRSKIFNIN